MTRRILLLLLVVLCPAGAQQLDAAKSAALRDRFLKKQQQTKSWAASFTQTVTMPGMKRPVVSTGTVTYGGAGRLRLDFTQPAGEFVLAAGDRLFLKKSGKSLSEKSLDRDHAARPFRSLLNLLQGQLAEAEAGYDAVVSLQSGSYSVVLTRKPGAKGRGPSRITNTVAADSLEVTAILIELPGTGSIHFSFAGPRRNHELPPALFADPTAAVGGAPR
jgi:outer membrane lipoprotein-sorting protein